MTQKVKSQDKKTCYTCGAELLLDTTRPSGPEKETEFARRRFCNRECARRYKTLSAKEQLDLMPFKVCIGCGKRLEKLPDDIPFTYSRRTCCSKECGQSVRLYARTKLKQQTDARGKKVCPICLIDKPLCEFPVKKAKQNKTGIAYYQSYCNSCEYEVRMETRLQRLFSLSTDEYYGILEYQARKCAICRYSSDKLLHVDHDHKTGKIRGLICWLCNRGLSYFRDNPERFKAAAEYLLNPPATTFLGSDRFGCKGKTSSKANRTRKLIISPADLVRQRHKKETSGTNN